MSLILISILVQPVLAVPGDWWGTVKINDLYIADGSIVKAFVNQNNTPATSVVAGSLISNYYLVHVEATNGDNVTFKVNNIVVNQSAQPWSKGDHEFNLSITVNDSLNSSVSLNSSQVMTLDSINETNTSLDIVTNSSVSGSVNIIKYSENPETINLGFVELQKYIQIEASSGISNVLSWSMIKIYYSHGELNGADENSLRIYFYNSSSGSWIPYNSPDGGVNIVQNYAWANITHFSYYGLFGSLAPYCGDGACNGVETCSSCPADCGSCAGAPITGGGGPIQISKPKNQTNKTVSGQAQSCTENWSCTDWSTCANSQQSRTCIDANNCRTIISKPVEFQSCAAEKVPTAASIVQTSKGLFSGLGTNEWMISIIASVAIVLVIVFIFLKKKRRNINP